MSREKSKRPQSKADAPSGRRQFLKQMGTGAAVTAAALAAPNVARAQDKVVLKFQSTWPAKDIFNEFAGDYVNKVNEMAGGRLELRPEPGEVLAAYRVGLHELCRDDSPRFVTIPESDRPVVQVPLGHDLIHAPTGAVLVQFRWLALEGRDDPVAGFEQPVFAWR